MSDLADSAEILRQSARKSLAGFLQSRTWDAFFTATFSKPANSPSLAVERVLRAMPHCSRAFIAAEPHRLGNFHAHGLVYNHAEDMSLALAEHYLDSFTHNIKRYGWSSVTAVREQGAVANYCAKYITKDMSDWRMLGDRDAWHKGVLPSPGIDKVFLAIVGADY